jgi:DNA-binding IclR family transcriptional regulator
MEVRVVKSATRVMQILELVGRSRDGLKHLDIAKALNIPKGSLSLLLSDLVGSEFLTIGEDDKRYRVGHKILVLAGRYLADLDIIKASQPFIRNVIAATNESCGLAMIMGGEAMIVWREETLEPLRWDFKIGDQNPLYASAHGKAILAFYSREKIDRYLSSVDLVPITPHTITDKKTLFQELDAIRGGAIAYSREENYVGITSMAVPVFNNMRQVIASLGTPIPSQRFSMEKEKLIGEALRKAAGLLSRELGYF